MEDTGVVESVKHKAVLQWLKDLFGDDPIPSFYKSESFVNNLYEMMTREKSLNKQIASFQSLVSTATTDYCDDLRHTNGILNRLGISDFSSAESSSLASLGSMLSLSNFEDSSYLLAMTDITLEKEHTSAELESLTQSLQTAATDLKNGIRLEHELEQLLGKLEKRQESASPTQTAQSREAEFLLQKVSKYKSDRRKYEENLSRSGLSSHFTHERLMEDEKELNMLKKKLEATNDELKTFSNLPPDKELAQVKLEVARSELQEIEDQLAKQIDMFHL